MSLVASGQRGVSEVTAWRMASVLGVYTNELFAPDPAESRPSVRASAVQRQDRPARLRNGVTTPARTASGAAPVPSPHGRPRRCPTTPNRPPFVSTPA
ncbi:hypothetical protein [Streptomyces luteireticuli]|uniref:hypothetical protein n=1 Tax=Streptomyces luteireticuli TaxID=173858 RepID=UPI003555CE89